MLYDSYYNLFSLKIHQIFIFQQHVYVAFNTPLWNNNKYLIENKITIFWKNVYMNLNEFANEEREEKKEGKEKKKNCPAQRFLFFIIRNPLCLIRLCQMPIRPSSNSTVKLPVPPSFIRAFNFARFVGTVVSSYVHETVRKIWNSACTRISCRSPPLVDRFPCLL